ADVLDGPGDVTFSCVGFSCGGAGFWWTKIGAHLALFCYWSLGTFSAGPRVFGRFCRVQEPHARHDHWKSWRNKGEGMKLSRRQLITTGIGTAAGATGLVAAAKIARRYGLVPPDSGGIYGPGETLTYAAQRVLTRHSMAREFTRSQISARPFANGV